MKSLTVAAALAAGLVGFSTQASAAVYAAQVLIGQFHCTGAWCTASFPKVPAGKTLTVNDASCIFTTTGSPIDAQLQWPIGAKTYYLGLASQWQRANGSNINSTFGTHATITVAAGKTLQAVIQTSGTMVGAHCEIFGTLD